MALTKYVTVLRDEGKDHVKLDRQSRSFLRQLKEAGKTVATVASPTPLPLKKTVVPDLTPIVTQTSSTAPVMDDLSELTITTGRTKTERLAHLAGRALSCQKCPHLVKFRNKVVFGVGDPEAELMFVGEAPGAEEDKIGEPFVGRAGDLLTKMIVAMGLTREKIYIANILKCRPDIPAGAPGNRKPTPEEMKTCSPYLIAQIEIIHPKVMVGLGASAVEGLLGPRGTISKLRGHFQEFRGIPFMPTFHPSYLLHNSNIETKRKVWEDLMQVMIFLKMPISEKQQGFFLAK